MSKFRSSYRSKVFAQIQIAFFGVHLNIHSMVERNHSTPLHATPLDANCFYVICPHCLRLYEVESGMKKKVLIFLFTFPKFFLRE